MAFSDDEGDEGNAPLAGSPQDAPRERYEAVAGWLGRDVTSGGSIAPAAGVAALGSPNPSPGGLPTRPGGIEGVAACEPGGVQPGGVMLTGVPSEVVSPSEVHCCELVAAAQAEKTAAVVAAGLAAPAPRGGGRPAGSASGAAERGACRGGGADGGTPDGAFPRPIANPLVPSGPLA
jgi:hypothetical protein